jgi:hypothetical protein
MVGWEDEAVDRLGRASAIRSTHHVFVPTSGGHVSSSSEATPAHVPQSVMSMVSVWAVAGQRGVHDANKSVSSARLGKDIGIEEAALCPLTRKVLGDVAPRAVVLGHRGAEGRGVKRRGRRGEGGGYGRTLGRASAA